MLYLSEKKKDETLEEFLARGGHIKKARTPQWQIDEAKSRKPTSRYKMADLGRHNMGEFHKKKR